MVGSARCSKSGERKYLSLTYSVEAPAVVPLLGEAARGRIERTVRWWQEWANRCAYEGRYREEAEAYIGWLLHATRLTWPELHVLYDVFGEARLPERELVHLEGYAGSRPVRIGNDAQGQLQLDVYGEVINGAARFLDRGGG